MPRRFLTPAIQTCPDCGAWINAPHASEVASAVDRKELQEAWNDERSVWLDTHRCGCNPPHCDGVNPIIRQKWLATQGVHP